MNHYLFVLLLLSALSCRARTADNQLSADANEAFPGFNIEELRRIVESPRGKEVRKLDDFLPLLPAELFKLGNSVLMRKSKSTCGKDVSPAKPRVILFNRAQRMMLAYVGDPDSACSESIEIIQGNPDETTSVPYQMVTLKFSKDDEPRLLNDAEHDAGCTGCHHDHLPIWGAHQTNFTNWRDEEWPAAFGGAAGSLIEGVIGGTQRSDVTEFKTFLANIDLPRYSRLKHLYATPLKKGFGPPKSEVFGEDQDKDARPTYEVFTVPNFIGLTALDTFILPGSALIDGHRANFPFIDPTKPQHSDLNPMVP